MSAKQYPPASDGCPNFLPPVRFKNAASLRRDVCAEEKARVTAKIEEWRMDKLEAMYGPATARRWSAPKKKEQPPNLNKELMTLGYDPPKLRSSSFCHRHRRLQSKLPRGFEDVFGKLVEEILVTRPTYILEFCANFLEAEVIRAELRELERYKPPTPPPTPPEEKKIVKKRERKKRVRKIHSAKLSTKASSKVSVGTSLAKSKSRLSTYSDDLHRYFPISTERDYYTASSEDALPSRDGSDSSSEGLPYPVCDGSEDGVSVGTPSDLRSERDYLSPTTDSVMTACHCDSPSEYGLDRKSVV